MRAMMIRSYGVPNVLEEGELPTPKARNGEVLVRLVRSGINPIDLGVRRGDVLPDEPDRFPMVLGWDGAGLVEEIGSRTTGVKVGDRVMVISKQPSSGVGLHADYAAVPREQVALLEDAVTFEDAAASPLVGVTALDAIEALGLRQGARVLINNANGAVGAFAEAVARSRGLEIADSDEIDVDGAIDVLGGEMAHKAFNSVKSGGAYVTVVPEFWKPGGPFSAARGITPVVVENAPTKSKLETIAVWLAEGVLKPKIETVLPLRALAEGHRRLEEPGLTQKILLNHEL